jgi:hypothetical protein
MCRWRSCSRVRRLSAAIQAEPVAHEMKQLRQHKLARETVLGQRLGTRHQDDQDDHHGHVVEHLAEEGVDVAPSGPSVSGCGRCCDHFFRPPARRDLWGRVANLTEFGRFGNLRPAEGETPPATFRRTAQVSSLNRPITGRVPSRARILRAMAIAALRKAAVFLGSLPERQATGLLAKLSPAEAAAVSAELAAMGPIDRQEQEAVIGELAGSDTSEVRDGPAAAVSPFVFLDGIAVDELLAAIGDERPQTIALILSQLPAEQAAGVIAALPPRQQAAVVARLARIEQPIGEIVAEVADAVHRRLAGPVRAPIGRGMVRLVKMFGAMRPATERKLLGGVAQADPELLRAIRRAMFGPDVAACGEWSLTAATS